MWRRPYRIFSSSGQFDARECRYKVCVCACVCIMDRNGTAVESMHNKIFLIIDFEANDTQRTFGIFFCFFFLALLLHSSFSIVVVCSSLSKKINFIDSLGFSHSEILMRLSWYLPNISVLLCIGDADIEKQFSRYIKYIRNSLLHINIKHMHMDGFVWVAPAMDVFWKKNLIFSIFIPDCCVPIKWRLAVQVNASQCTLDLWLSQYRCTNQSLPG